jgi:hypothetical protein
MIPNKMEDQLRLQGLRFGDVLPFITRAVKGNAAFYGAVRVRHVMIYTYEKWINAICFARIYPKDHEPPKQSDVLYPHLQLREVWLSCKDFLNQMSEQSLSTSNLHMEFREDRTWERSILSYPNQYLDDQGTLYKTLWQDKLTISPFEHLLQYDLPYHPNSMDAVRDWIQLKSIADHHNPYESEFVLFLPECRASFDTLSLRKRKLRIRVKINDPQLADLRIKGGWRENGAFIPIDEKAASIDLVVASPDDVDLFNLFLIGSDGTIFDFHLEQHSWPQHQQTVFGANIQSSLKESEIAVAIDNGEGPDLEFKPYIKLDAGSEKANEIIETVIAFANADGGRILFGVANDGTPIGIDQDIHKLHSKGTSQLKQGCRKYIRLLRQFIANRIHRRLRLDCQTIRVQGHTLLVMRVPRREDGVYMDSHGNAIYVRRGATNARANEQDLVRLFGPQGFREFIK